MVPSKHKPTHNHNSHTNNFPDAIHTNYTMARTLQTARKFTGGKTTSLQSIKKKKGPKRSKKGRSKRSKKLNKAS